MKYFVFCYAVSLWKICKLMDILNELLIIKATEQNTCVARTRFLNEPSLNNILSLNWSWARGCLFFNELGFSCAKHGTCVYKPSYNDFHTVFIIVALFYL